MDKEVFIRDERLQSLNGRVIFLDQEVNARDQRIISQEKALQELNNELISRSEQSSILETKLKTRDHEALNLNNRLAGLHSEIESKNEAICKQEQAMISIKNTIAAIYDSETYRLIVKPVLWPLFSFVKRMIGLPRSLLKKPINKPAGKKTVFIAQAHLKNAEPRPGERCEYFVKLVNRSFSKEKAKLLIDIWPYEFRAHPERHYFYSAINLELMPRGLVELDIFYEWGEKMEFFVGDKEMKPADYWRGDMKIGRELYAMYIDVLSDQGELMDRQEFLINVKE